MDEFIKLVEKMRKSQKGFFKSKFGTQIRQKFLDDSKKYEKQVDDFIKNYKDPQKSLLDESNH